MRPGAAERQAAWEAAGEPVWRVYREDSRIAVTFCRETVAVWTDYTGRRAYWLPTYTVYGVEIPGDVMAEVLAAQKGN